MNEELRVWHVQAVTNGYRPSFVKTEAKGQSILLIGLFDGPHCHSLSACDAECQRRNKEQIDNARKALIAAQVRWNEVRALFNVPF